MPDFEKKEFLEFALEQHVFDIPLQAVELRSGGKSKWYISWRGVAGRVGTRRMLCAYILDFMKDQGIEPDSVLGVPVGATGIADRVQERLSAYRKGDNRVLAVGRKEPKIGIASPYNWFVQPPEGMTLVLEDTGTGFNSAMDWVERVNTLDNARVRWALAITDREQFGRYGQSGGIRFTDMGIPFYRMSTGLEILRTELRGRQSPDLVRREIIESEIRKYERGVGLEESLT